MLDWDRTVSPRFVVSDVDGLITQALLTGDFVGAVELCLHDNRMADSIILAIAGGSELLEKTQRTYFSKSHTKLTKVKAFVFNHCGGCGAALSICWR